LTICNTGSAATPAHTSCAYSGSGNQGSIATSSAATRLPVRAV